MTRNDRFRTPAAALALLALAVVVVSPAAGANPFRESDADTFLHLQKSALLLYGDVNNGMGVLGQRGEFDQASCLSELENALVSIMDVLSSAYDLVKLSAGMRDSLDEATINVTLAVNARIAMKQFAEDRRHALAQGALCSTSALVNTYAQKTAAITDEATVLFSAINNRIGWLVQHRP
jgi:hypothetical protein